MCIVELKMIMWYNNVELREGVKIMQKHETQNVERFTLLSDEKLNLLKYNRIKTLGQLSNNTRSNLKELGFENFEIKKIDVELQLLGMGLREN